MRAPGRRYEEPRTATTVASKNGAPSRRSAAASRTMTSSSLMAGSEQLVEGDGQVADPLPGGVVDGVGDGCADAGDPELADALRADLVHVRIVLGDHDHVDGGNVGVDGDVVVLQ